MVLNLYKIFNMQKLLISMLMQLSQNLTYVAWKDIMFFFTNALLFEAIHIYKIMHIFLE